MDTKERFIGFLRHYRHDWLNHLQIIKAYLSMDKKDELCRYLNQLIVQVHDEARLSQLGDPELSYFLLTYNWVQDKLHLDVEIESTNGEEFSKLGEEYPYLLPLLQQIIGLLEEICLPFDENRLLLLFSYEENQLMINFDLLGQWDRRAVNEKVEALEELVAKKQGKLEYDLHNQEHISFVFIAQKECLSKNRGVDRVC